MLLALPHTFRMLRVCVCVCLCATQCLGARALTTVGRASQSPCPRAADGFLRRLAAMWRQQG